MKLLLVAVLALGSLDAFGYSANVGADPINGNPDLETKVVVKSTTAGLSDAIAKGDFLGYVESASLGYIVSRVSQAGAAVPSRLAACVADRAIPTSNSATVARASCITKGYVDFLSYDATTPIVSGSLLCPNAVGAAVVCAATQSSGVVALEAKASGTGTDLKAIINLK